MTKIKKDIKISSKPPQRPGKNYILAIAINDYVQYSKLSNSIKDVKDVIKVLTEKYRFREEDIFELFDATAEEINTKVSDLKEIISGEDSLIILFSGHGIYDKESDTAYWLPKNANFHQRTFLIETDALKRRIRGFGAFHTLYIIDSCYAGKFRGQDNADSRVSAQRSSYVLASGREEVVEDGTPGQNSPFATSLIKFLRENNETLRTSKLVDFVMDEVATKTKQTPIGYPLFDSGHEGGQFVFELSLTEEEYLEKAKKTKDRLWPERYLRNFPSGNLRQKV